MNNKICNLIVRLLALIYSMSLGVAAGDDIKYDETEQDIQSRTQGLVCYDNVCLKSVSVSDVLVYQCNQDGSTSASKTRLKATVRRWGTPFEIGRIKGGNTLIAVPYYYGGGTGVGQYHWLIVMKHKEEMIAIKMGLWRYQATWRNKKIMFHLGPRYIDRDDQGTAKAYWEALCVWGSMEDLEFVQLHLKMRINNNNHPELILSEGQTPRIRRLKKRFPKEHIIHKWLNRINLEVNCSD